MVTWILSTNKTLTAVSETGLSSAILNQGPSVYNVLFVICSNGLTGNIDKTQLYCGELRVKYGTTDYFLAFSMSVFYMYSISAALFHLFFTCLLWVYESAFAGRQRICNI